MQVISYCQEPNHVESRRAIRIASLADGMGLAMFTLERMLLVLISGMVVSRFADVGTMLLDVAGTKKECQ